MTEAEVTAYLLSLSTVWLSGLMCPIAAHYETPALLPVRLPGRYL